MKIKKLIALCFIIVSAISCKKNNSIKNPDNPSGPGTTPGTFNQLSILPGETIFNVLPKRVGFGVQSEPEYLPQTIPMKGDYIYTYLINTWETWNSPLGEYALLHMKNVSNAGKMPVLTYYVIVGQGYYSDPAIAKLSNAEMMKQYFENWRLLMQKCAEFNKPVIIHYEPDFSAYLQLEVINQNNDPEALGVKVKSSGFTDAQISIDNYADNVKGMFQLLKTLRDQYAPKVILGYQISHWSTGTDFILNKTDPLTAAEKTISFYKKLDADFDVLFSEFSDRDAAWFEINKKQDRWWADADFESFRIFLKEAHGLTNKRIFLWQIPAGNTKFKACDNTDKHYQDNRPEFFFEEMNADKNERLFKYGQAGVIGYLFGHGIGTCTAPYDEDGVVNNPAPINGNNRDAIDGTKDDDGGYIRNSLKNYYETNSKTLIEFK